MLRVIAAASPPSASSHLAPGFRPASSRIVRSGTPVHSEVDVRPCVPCTVFIVGFDHSVRPFPEHSMNIVLEIDGKRLMSFIENFFGDRTMPCTNRLCLPGSITAVPPWLRSKWSPEGVTMPRPACNGVKLQDDSGVAVLKRTRTSVSNCDRLP